MNNKQIGTYLHQLLNHSTMIRNYAEYFVLATPDKNIKHICKQLDSNIYTLLNKLCAAIGRKELQDFADRKIIGSQRMLDLMEINELVSRLNDESIAIVCSSLKEQLQPILDAEFNQNQKTIEYAE